MAKNTAKFGINDILNAKSRTAGIGNVSEYTEIWMSPYDVKPSESNFYSQENIEECNAALYSRRKKHFIFDSINTITALSFR